MNKKQFVKHINRIKEFDEIEDKLNKAFSLLVSKGGLDTYINLEKPTTYLIEILKDAMNDKFEHIDYFIYELDFGKNSMAKNCIIEKDSKKVSLQTPGQLYDYLKSIN